MQTLRLKVLYYWTKLCVWSYYYYVKYVHAYDFDKDYYIWLDGSLEQIEIKSLHYNIPSTETTNLWATIINKGEEFTLNGKQLTEIIYTRPENHRLYHRYSTTIDVESVHTPDEYMEEVRSILATHNPK